MSLAQTLSVVVDDTDPSIQYSGGPWFQDSSASDNQGALGRSLYETLHGTQQYGTITYIFKGTKVLAAGANRNTTTGAIPPTWRCLVDGVSIDILPFAGAQNRWPLCETDVLADGQHNITVLAQVASGQVFWFDYFQYAPSRDVALDNADVYLSATDPSIQYGAGWEVVEAGRVTSQAGASVNVTFHGTALIWFGLVPGNSSSLPATATFAVDPAELAPSLVVLGGQAAAAPTTSSLHNQLLFQTPRLAAGVHTLEVVYNGTAASAPLGLDSLIIQNGTGAPLRATPSSSAGPASPAAARSKNTDTAVLVGGVASGLVIIGLCTALVFLYRRYRKVRIEQKQRYIPGFAPGYRDTIDPSIDGVPAPARWDASGPDAGVGEALADHATATTTVERRVVNPDVEEALEVSSNAQPPPSYTTGIPAVSHNPRPK